MYVYLRWLNTDLFLKTNYKEDYTLFTLGIRGLILYGIVVIYWGNILYGIVVICMSIISNPC